MIRWLRGLFQVRCPECGTFHVRDRTSEVFTMTYNIYYECANGHQWKVSGL